ncbi:hypothetical protein KAM451_35330 [Aeromonas caviae]|uniref:Uncharacterized protein n=1 Tax=Aeromonas caviae TaxID=648 RepID=A0ABD0B8F2_AERCA|nr:hypothetical protein KAM382_24120 [Aeromonas caviae]GKQ94767.1 hypothetical protein KAM451_35330 [Aeromonas caviae]
MQHCKQQDPGPLDNPIWSGLWLLTKTPKFPRATPSPQDVVLAQRASATTSSGSAEDLARAAPSLAPPALLTFRAIR